MKIPVPEHEQERLQRLQQLNILDTLPEKSYNDIVFLASQITRSPIAMISLVDEERQWFKAKIGMDATQTAREHAFCAHAIANPNQLMVVNDALEDERFSDNPLVQGEPRIRFYAGTPLTTHDGFALGTLCVIDRDPKELGFDQFMALEALGRTVVSLLELRLSLQLLQQTQSIPSENTEAWKRLQDSRRGLLQSSELDTLTGLMNRQTFETHLEREFQLVRRKQSDFAFFLIEVDQELGEPTLPNNVQRVQQLASLLTRNLQARDVICRFSGWRFACFLPGANESTARNYAEKLRIAVLGKAVDLTVSIGYSHAINQSIFTLFQSTEQALTHAKQMGGNQLVAASTP